jgi:hypothetical protein
MTKKRAIILAAIAIGLLLAAVCFWGPSSVPTGQQPLVVLSDTNFKFFENAFDDDASTPRLVLLLSPT